MALVTYRSDRYPPSPTVFVRRIVVAGSPSSRRRKRRLVALSVRMCTCPWSSSKCKLHWVRFTRVVPHSWHHGKSSAGTTSTGGRCDGPTDTLRRNYLSPSLPSPSIATHLPHALLRGLMYNVRWPGLHCRQRPPRSTNRASERLSGVWATSFGC